MKKAWIIVIAALFAWGGCGDVVEEPDVAVTSASVSSFTPRAYKDGDYFESIVTLVILLPEIGNVSFSGTLTVEITDGGTANGCTCLLATTTIDVTSTNSLAILAGLQHYTTVEKAWFYEDGAGLHIAQTEDDEGTIEAVGVSGTGVLDTPYAIGATAFWNAASGDLRTLDGTFSVTVAAGTFDCYAVNIITATQTVYITSDLGALVPVHGVVDIEGGGRLTMTISSYTLIP